MGSACEIRNLGELIEKPGKQKGRRSRGEGEEEEDGVRCVMTGLNKTSNRKNYFGALAGPASPRRPAESTLVLAGGRAEAADSHERRRSAGFEGSAGSGGGESGERCTGTDQR